MRQLMESCYVAHKPIKKAHADIRNGARRLIDVLSYHLHPYLCLFDSTMRSAASAHGLVKLFRTLNLPLHYYVYHCMTLLLFSG